MKETVIVGLFFAGLVASAWLAVPAGAVAAAGPLVLYILVFHFLPLAPSLGHLIQGRLMDRAEPVDLADNAAKWLRVRLVRLGLETKVVTGDSASYSPTEDVIELPGPVYGSRGAAGRATAAHELGHAILYDRRPRLASVLLWCRRWYCGAWLAGMSLLVAGSLVTAPMLAEVAGALIAVGAVLGAGVLIDELCASLLGSRMLDLDRDLDPRSRRASARYLALAFFSYLLQITVMVIPALSPPQLGPGAIEPGAPLTGVLALLAGVGAAIAIGGAVSAVVHKVRRKPGFLSVVAILAMELFGPVFVLLVANQPQVLAQPWVLAIGLAASWSLLLAPVFIAVHFGFRRVRQAVVGPSPPILDDGWRALRSRERTRPERYRGSTLAANLYRLAWQLAFLPVALAYFGWL